MKLRNKRFSDNLSAPCKFQWHPVSACKQPDAPLFEWEAGVAQWTRSRRFGKRVVRMHACITDPSSETWREFSCKTDSNMPLFFLSFFFFLLVYTTQTRSIFPPSSGRDAPRPVARVTSFHVTGDGIQELWYSKGWRAEREVNLGNVRGDWCIRYLLEWRGREREIWSHFFFFIFFSFFFFVKQNRIIIGWIVIHGNVEEGYISRLSIVNNNREFCLFEPSRKLIHWMYLYTCVTCYIWKRDAKIFLRILFPRVHKMRNLHEQTSSRSYIKRFSFKISCTISVVRSQE